ncbi:MAG: hypothetical protein PHP00_03310 [Thiotrichaceae bacterium]|nr:hypothetical protein [Thiotrichaceae bacterium]
MISLIKHSLVLAFSRLRSKFLTNDLHLSTQALERSTTDLALTGTKPVLQGLADSSNWSLSLISG